MSAKQGAIFGATFGGACGGMLSAGLVQYLSGDDHYLPLVLGTLGGAAIAGLTTALVTCNNLGKSISEHSPADHRAD